MSWHRIDEHREISTDFITCAEYQLFIDEERVRNSYRQPDHWESEQFPKGQAQAPILGVRGKDARRFCTWLSQQQRNKFIYRPPTLEEAFTSYPQEAGVIGYWCMTAGKRLVYSVDLSQWKKWQEFFFSTFAGDWNRIISLTRNCTLRDFARNHTSSLNRDCILDRARTLDLTSALNLDFDFPPLLAYMILLVSSLAPLPAPVPSPMTSTLTSPTAATVILLVPALLTSTAITFLLLLLILPSISTVISIFPALSTLIIFIRYASSLVFLFVYWRQGTSPLASDLLGINNFG